MKRIFKDLSQILIIILIIQGNYLSKSNPNTIVDDALDNVIQWAKEEKSVILNSTQISNTKSIIENYLKIDTEKDIQLDRLWYIIATAYHESKLNQMIEKRVEDYGSQDWDDQNKYWFTGYYGRGYSQLKFQNNYLKFSKYIGIDLLGKPKLAIDPKYSTIILNVGFFKGVFTGKGIKKFVNDTDCDYFNARQVIHDMDDAAETVAGYASGMYNIWGGSKRECKISNNLKKLKVTK